MEDYLYQKDLWKPLEGKTKNQESMSNDEYNQMMNRIFLTEKHLEEFDYAWHHQWHLTLQKQRQQKS